MFSKIGNLLGKTWDFGSSLIKPFKNTLANGWSALKNGASKVGSFVANNHEAIGSILSGVGNIIGNMSNSPLKQKLSNLSQGAQSANNFVRGGFSNLRPSNAQRQQFNNNLLNRQANTPALQANTGQTANNPRVLATPQSNNNVFGGYQGNRAVFKNVI